MNIRSGHKIAEHSPKMAETNYREIFDKSSDAIYVHEIETGRVIDVNDRAAELTGFSKYELLTNGPDIHITGNPDYTLQHAMNYINKAAMGEPQSFEWLGKKKDGSHNWFEVHLKRATIGGQDRILAFFREINDRKKMESVLKEKVSYVERRTAEISEMLLKYTLMDFSEELRISDKGDELDAIAVGLNTMKEELESHIAQLKQSEEKYKYLFNSIDEGYCVIEMIFDEKKKPADYRFLEINESFERQTGLRDAVGKRMREFAPDHEQHWFDTYGKIALTGESIRFENRAEALHRWYDVYAFRFGDPKNLQVAILFNDITERKKAEEQLMAVNKELEAFTYSVSHDLRAPLRAINGFATIFSEDYVNKLDEEGNRLLDVIRENAKKMGVLIDDLLTFSRLGRKEIQKVNVNMKELVETTVMDITKSSTHRADVEIGSLHPAFADSGLISHVFVNLISNGIKYSSKAPAPKVSITSWRKDGEVVYSVKDNGVGFDMKYAHKLFGVFQRLHTQEEFEGTGVGLAIVDRIVRKHGGRVWAEAELGKGATFNFSLPIN